MTWVFLLRARYSMVTSFFRISALVADVPIPEPLICSLRLSSSMSWPAFSIARIIDPDVYLLGGEVSPSLIVSESTGKCAPFFSFDISTPGAISVFSFCSSDVFPPFADLSPPVTFSQPSFTSTLELAKKLSRPSMIVIAVLSYSAGG